MVQNAAPELVISEIEAMIGKIARSAAAAANYGPPPEEWGMGIRAKG